MDAELAVKRADLLNIAQRNSLTLALRACAAHLRQADARLRGGEVGERALMAVGPGFHGR